MTIRNGDSVAQHSVATFQCNIVPTLQRCVAFKWSRVTYPYGDVARDDSQRFFLISYGVYMMTGSFHISLFGGTLHLHKIHVCFKIANITRALPVPVCRQTGDLTPKRVVVSRLHDTVARFRPGTTTGVNSAG